MGAGGLALMRPASWSDLTIGPAACGTEAVLTFEGCQVVHFQDHDEADVHLTAPVTARLASGLSAYAAVRVAPAAALALAPALRPALAPALRPVPAPALRPAPAPGKKWITALLDVESGAELLLSSAGAALKAHQRPRLVTAPARCNRAASGPPDPLQGGPGAPGGER